MSSNNGTETLVLTAIRSQNLDTVCYRGEARLCDLTRATQTDMFDQETNPGGIQRDFSKPHALDVWEYLSREPDPDRPRAFPEVVLNVRDKKVCKIKEVGEMAGLTVVEITVDMAALERARSAKISRLDGNHRLLFGNGDDKDRRAIELSAPFQLHYGLGHIAETSLFVDLNAKQKKLNTSHLAWLTSTITPQQQEIISHPARVYARRLAEDEASPFYDKVYMGGSKRGSKEKGVTFPLTFVALENAVKRMLRTSTMLKELSDADMTYAAIRNYWQAVRSTWGEDFEHPDTMFMRSLGVNSLAQFSAHVLDRVYMSTGEFDAVSLAEMLEPTKTALNWHKDADLAGKSGNTVPLAVSETMAKKLPKLKPAKK